MNRPSEGTRTGTTPRIQPGPVENESVGEGPVPAVVRAVQPMPLPVLNRIPNTQFPSGNGPEIVHPNIRLVPTGLPSPVDPVVDHDSGSWYIRRIAAGQSQRPHEPLRRTAKRRRRGLGGRRSHRREHPHDGDTQHQHTKAHEIPPNSLGADDFSPLSSQETESPRPCGHSCPRQTFTIPSLTLTTAPIAVNSG